MLGLPYRAWNVEHDVQRPNWPGIASLNRPAGIGSLTSLGPRLARRWKVDSGDCGVERQISESRAAAKFRAADNPADVNHRGNLRSAVLAPPSQSAEHRVKLRSSIMLGFVSFNSLL